MTVSLFLLFGSSSVLLVLATILMPVWLYNKCLNILPKDTTIHIKYYIYRNYKQYLFFNPHLTLYFVSPVTCARYNCSPPSME